MVFQVACRSVAKRSFQSTARRSLTIPFLSTLPQAPGGVKGNVNDAYVPPPPHKTHGSLHWDFERAVAVCMPPLVGSALASGGDLGTVADSLLCSALFAHLYIGFQSCIIDYIPKRVYGKNYNYAMYLLTLGSIVGAVGVYKLETEEEGLTGVVQKLWTSEQKGDNK
ncbi:LAMI_0H18272g1_1 [Lachancea mirantina]|uniref:Succinate dehydrogenase [ubiquinone] cytochrome b small subunit n=1 Tax=Lachancea mirantina TaxID=1230905 RepID=A0A1G4KJZ2_9SACH|nr:LAMI_0H18272g1_1 [Lachancea mirantina]